MTVPAGPVVVVVLGVEAAPQVMTVAASSDEARRLLDWLFEGTRDDRVRDLLAAAVRLVTERP